MNRLSIHTLLLISLLFPLMLAARNPFVWDEKIQPIECGMAVPRLESISIDPYGMRLAFIKHNNEGKVFQEGERVGQWKIKAIQYNSAVLQGLDGKICTISLHLDDV